MHDPLHLRAHRMMVITTCGTASTRPRAVMAGCRLWPISMASRYAGPFTVKRPRGLSIR